MRVDAYCFACQLKKIRVFAIFIKNLEFQAVKKARRETIPKIIVKEKYYDFLNLFCNKKLEYTFF